MKISYQLPESLNADIDHFEELIASFKQGEISAAELKAYRVPFGIYEQRELGTYMLRIRCAAGILTPLQLKEIAAIASEFGTKQLHITTRQELQVHYVKLEDMIAIIRRLKVIGLASRGGGGNTVRNVITPEDAGIDPKEVFDVTPYAISLTTRLIAEGDSWTLPRKFKVAFSGSSEDKGNATIADVGFIAVKKDGINGFRVYVAGGMGARSQEGNILFDFIGVEDVYAVTRAVKMLFWKHGNRKNKHAARLRFVWQKFGAEEFKKKFEEEYDDVKKESPAFLQVEDIANVGAHQDIEISGRDAAVDFELWKKRFVRAQKQADLFSIIIPVKFGFIENEDAGKLARFLEPFGDNVIRMSKDQNFLIRNISEKYLPHVHHLVRDVFGEVHRSLVLDKAISCAGASTCQLGICLSRGAFQAMIDRLQEKRIDLDVLSDIKIYVSGCPNACGQHPIADLGFFGKAARKEGRLYPAYNVVAGAVVEDGKTKFAKKVGEISAKDLPAFVDEFLSAYLLNVDDRGFKDYIQGKGKEDLKKLCAKFSNVPTFEKDESYYVDWGADKAFSMAERGSGECASGLFDLIDVDLKNIDETKKKRAAADGEDAKKEILSNLVFYASRMLLITRGVESRTKEDVYRSFCEHFVETGLVDKRFMVIISAAQNNTVDLLLEKENDVNDLLDRVALLYEHMDNAFQFRVPNDAIEEKEVQDDSSSSKAAVNEKAAHVTKDLRGTACPMNFVKTKMFLHPLKRDELLEIWLDDGEPIENVPGSVKEEGHEIISQEKVDEYWKVLIQKK